LLVILCCVWGQKFFFFGDIQIEITPEGLHRQS
jgi:hypothetical protein